MKVKCIILAGDLYDPHLTKYTKQVDFWGNPFTIPVGRFEIVDNSPPQFTLEK